MQKFAVLSALVLAVLEFGTRGTTPAQRLEGLGDGYALQLGTAWYPEQWPESRWETDPALMEAAYHHFVRVGEFAWSRMEHSEGHDDLDWLSRAIGSCIEKHRQRERRLHRRLARSDGDGLYHALHAESERGNAGLHFPSQKIRAFHPRLTEQAGVGTREPVGCAISCRVGKCHERLSHNTNAKHLELDNYGVAVLEKIAFISSA